MNISKFTDLVEIISGGTPNTHIKEYWSGNISWLSIADFKNVNKYVLKTEKKITSLGLEQSSTKILNKNSIIISARGTVGALAMLAMPMAFNQSCFGLTTKNNSVIINEYIYYYLKNYIKILKYKKEGSVFGTIDTSTFENINLKYPNTKIQYQITSTLSVIDSLIDNNNNIYSELEKMAKTLYDYWFVQFDFPDENGRPYKSSGGKMVWSEELQREIPYGWEVHSLTKYCYFYNGYAFSSSTYCDNGKYKVYTIKNITNYGIDATNCSFINDIPQRMNNECILKPGDILLTLTGHVGRVGIVFETNALLNQRVLKLVSNHQILLYLILIDKNINKQIVNKANGSSQKNLSPNILHDILYPYPSQNIINKFTKQYDNIYNKLILIKQKNQELTSLRDFLLPLLMNGQAVIKE